MTADLTDVCARRSSVSADWRGVGPLVRCLRRILLARGGHIVRGDKGQVADARRSAPPTRATTADRTSAKYVPLTTRFSASSEQAATYVQSVQNVSRIKMPREGVINPGFDAPGGWPKARQTRAPAEWAACFLRVPSCSGAATIRSMGRRFPFRRNRLGVLMANRPCRSGPPSVHSACSMYLTATANSVCRRVLGAETAADRPRIAVPPARRRSIQILRSGCRGPFNARGGPSLRAVDNVFPRTRVIRPEPPRFRR